MQTLLNKIDHFGEFLDKIRRGALTIFRRLKIKRRTRKLPTQHAAFETTALRNAKFGMFRAIFRHTKK